MELHLFFDASPKAYGAVAYFRINYLTKISTKFVIAKSRIAPLKPITLLRLELLGALISARLESYLRNIFPILKEKDVYLWCDSEICLYWIKEASENVKQTRGMRLHTLINDAVLLSAPAWLQIAELPSGESQIKFNSDAEINELEREMKDVRVPLQTS